MVLSSMMKTRNLNAGLNTIANYTGLTEANRHFINGIPGLPILEQLDEPPDVSEIILNIKSLSSDKAAGSDETPAKFLKAGLDPLAVYSYTVL